MKIILILWITIFTSNSYSFELKLDIGAVTDALEQVTEELSKNIKTEEEVQEEVQVQEEVKKQKELYSVCKNPEVLVKDNNLPYKYINNTLDLIKAYSIVVKQGDQNIEYIFSGDDEGGTLTLINLKSNESENNTYKIKPSWDDKKIIINDVNMKIVPSINEQGEPYIKFWREGDQNETIFDIIGFRDRLTKIACETKNSYQVLNENIDSNNQINLVYCKYKENYSVIKDINNYKKGDGGEFDSYYIFTELDKGTENNKCPNLDEYNKKKYVKEIEINTINYKRITAEEFEKHNLDLTIKNNYPLGKNVTLKLPNGGNFRYEEKVLESKDLIKYCLLKNSEDKPWIKPGEPIITLAWFGEVYDQPGASGGKVWEAGCGDNDGRTSHNSHYSKIIKVSKGKISRNDVPEYIPYHVLFEKAEKEKKAKEEKERIEKETEEAAIKEQIEFNNRPENKLIDAYTDYMIIKNLSSQYGGYGDLDESKKLIKLIENHYKDLVDTSVDTLWKKATRKYENEYSRDIETLASFYSSQGDSYYKLSKMSLQGKANKIGVSTADTNKDF